MIITFQKVWLPIRLPLTFRHIFVVHFQYFMVMVHIPSRPQNAILKSKASDFSEAFFLQFCILRRKIFKIFEHFGNLRTERCGGINFYLIQFTLFKNRCAAANPNQKKRIVIRGTPLFNSKEIL